MPGVGTNRYAYAANDPVNKADANGNALTDSRDSKNDDDDANREDAGTRGVGALSLGREALGERADGIGALGSPEISEATTAPTDVAMARLSSIEQAGRIEASGSVDTALASDQELSRHLLTSCRGRNVFDGCGP
jgi:hypothetical protein